VKVHPTVLLATTSRWYPTARLAMALADAGCIVDAVCPARHPLLLTHAARRVYAYHGLAPLSSLRHAIDSARPDLVVSGDDLATHQLHRLFLEEQRGGKKDSEISALIARSLGPAESFSVVSERGTFIARSEQAGVRVPSTRIIESPGELRNWIAEIGLPVVLKADGSSGGDGVKVARTVEEAERALRKLQSPPLLARALKRTLMDHDSTLLWPSLLRQRRTVSCQAFIAGREATGTMFCWKGTVVASLNFEVLHKTSSNGHATVMRLVENAEMSSAAEKIARQLDLSGIYGLDFMLESDTGHAFLIELNPRAPQVGHLTLGAGRDIPAALYAAVSDRPAQPAPAVTDKDTIALFPQEWIRDPESPLLRTGYHDVPWQSPELVRDCIASRRRQAIWSSRAQRQQDAAAISSLELGNVSSKTPAVGSDMRSR
jgi:hypothetical protein